MYDSATLASIASSLRAGQYNLLLGAGVSLDARNAQGALPSTEAFREDLCSLKSARASSTLQRVFSTLSEHEVSSVVVPRFVNCVPGPSVTKIPKFLWRRIFTFNIDDALEAAYAADQTYQTPQIFHFDDTYTELPEASDVPIVHLHGWVGSPSRGYVFALSEYVRQIRAINPWMVVLTQFMRVEPFVIAGTSLDEVDLEYYLAHRSPTTARTDRGPSILVEPNPDSVTQKDCEKYGLLLFKGTANDFWDYLDLQVPNRPTPIEHVPKNIQLLFPAGTPKRAIVAFSADFELVPEQAPINETASRFLFGHPPAWDDLAGNQDISRNLTAPLVAEIEQAIKKRDIKDRVILFVEDTGAGKTTVLRRLAFELAQKKAVKVLMCSSLSQIDAQRTSELIDLIDDPLVIVVDNIADQANAIADTIDRLEKRDVVVVCSDRRYRSKYVENVFSKIAFEKASRLTFDDVDAGRLIALYLHFGLLGNSEAIKRPLAFARQLKDDPIAIACCRILNDFRPLDRIIKSIFDDATERDRERYLVAALAQFCFRGGVRYEILASISGRDGWDDQFERSHPMPLAYVEGYGRTYIVPLNPSLASTILDSLIKDGREKLFRAFVDLGNALAPHVNPGAIRRRSPEARLAGRLFDYDQMVRNFLGDLSGAFYEEIRELWQWNSRYWDQVALLNLSRYYAAPLTDHGRDALLQAIQHARHAVSIEVHPFSLTTLGTVLLAQIGPNEGSLADIYDEGFGSLTAAIDRERHWSHRNPHSLSALFSGTHRFIESGGQLTAHQRARLDQDIREAQKLFPRDQEMGAAVSQLKLAMHI
jgi:SIR2-like domain